MRIRITIQKIKENADLFEPQHEAEISRDYMVSDSHIDPEIDKWGTIVNDMILVVKDKDAIE